MEGENRLRRMEHYTDRTNGEEMGMEDEIESRIEMDEFGDSIGEWGM